MSVEVLNIHGQMVPHTIAPIEEDGASLYRALSFLMYDSQLLALQVHDQITEHVVNNWEQFSAMFHDSNGDSYASPAQYLADKSKPLTHCGYYELMAAGQLFDFVFEVYTDGELYAKSGAEGNPVRRLRLSKDLLCSHFDAYMPNADLPITKSPLSLAAKKNPRKRRCVYTDVKRKKQIRAAAKKYAKKNPAVNRAAQARYKERKYHREHTEPQSSEILCFLK